MGFGATGREVDAAVERGISTYVTESLAGQTVDDPGVRATPLPHFDDIQRLGRSASASARKRVNAQIGEQLSELTEWWLHRMIAASNPVTEKLTFIWHSHFATSAAKVRTASAMAGQNEKFRSLGRWVSAVGIRHADRPGDAPLARRSAEHQEGTQREPGP